MKKHLLSPAGTLCGLATLLLLWATPVSEAASDPGAAPVPSGRDAFATRFERGDLWFDPGRVCSADASLSPSTAASLRSGLEADLRPILSRRFDVTVRRQMALFLAARRLQEAAKLSNDTFVEIIKQIGSERPEQMISALYDLRSKLVLTARMRETRATLADLQAGKDGKLELKLRTFPPGPEVDRLVASLLLGELEQAREEGLDCSRAEVYPLLQPYAGDRRSLETSIKHGDLLKYYDQAGRLSDVYTQRLGSSIRSGSSQEKQDASQVIEIYTETQALYGKALRVLQNALELYDRYLQDVRKSSEPEPVTPASSAPAAPTTGSTPATPGSAQPAGGSSPTGSQPPSPTEPPLSPTASRDAYKSAVIQEVTRQTQLLRGQRGPDGRPLGAEPSSVANNLATRIKRIYQAADMLAAQDKGNDWYECAMGEGRIHVTYSKTKGSLREIRIAVDEKYEDEVVLNWFVTMDRTDDANFAIRSEFNGIKASMEMENANLTEYPNYQQILVLMNRINDILYKK